MSEKKETLSERELAFIATEENILKDVLCSLDQQIQTRGLKLSQGRTLARELTMAIVGARSEEDKQMLASDEAVAHRHKDHHLAEAQRLESVIEQPYFARMIVEEEHDNGPSRHIEYKLGFNANPDCHIVDWRKAPIAKLYYEYSEGESYTEEILGRERRGRILYKSKVKIAKGRLVEVSGEAGNFLLSEHGWQKSSIDNQSRTNYAQLPDVLSLVTAEQFRAITSDNELGVFLQGVAGSGKTTVGLHRLSWQQANIEGSAENTGIIVVNTSLALYLNNTIAHMQLNTTVQTYTAWIERELNKRKILKGDSQRLSSLPPLGYARLKRSEAMLCALENYVADQRRRLLEQLDTLGIISALNPKLSARFYREELGPICLVDICLKEISETSAKDKAHELETLKKRLSLYESDLLRILSQPRPLLDRDTTRLLDLETIKHARERTAANIQAGRIDFEDDSLLVLLDILKRKGSTYESKSKFKLLLVDEVQEFGPIELDILLHSVHSPEHLTLIGDVAQQTDPDASFPGWKALAKLWEQRGRSIEMLTLEVSHRASLPLQNLAAAIAGQKPVKRGRPGKPAILCICPNEERALSELTAWLEKASKRYQGKIISVLCSSRKEAKFLANMLEPKLGHLVRYEDSHCLTFNEGVLVASIEDVKGLEFPAAALWRVDRQTYPQNARSQNLLYTAVTRSQNHLFLACVREPSTCLPPKHSKHYRLVDLRGDEDE